MTKKFISGIVASTVGVTGVIGTMAYTSSTGEDCLDGATGQTPYRINLTEAFFGDGGCYTGDNVEEPIIIESMSFTTKTNTTKLPDYKAYLLQGIVYYTDSTCNDVTRTFSDCVSVDDEDYSLVTGQEALMSQFTIGSEEHPLNMLLNEMCIEYTWCTASELYMYDLTMTDTKDNVYMVSMGEIYAAYISEKEVPDTHVATGLPFKCNFYVSSTYWEPRPEGPHRGMDLCTEGDPTIYAVEGGYVEYCDWENPYDWSQGFGQYIKIVGDDGLWYYYGHCSELLTSPGARVEAGQPIAVEGSTGYSTGNHLHFEVRDNGCAIDCSEILNIPNEYGEVVVEVPVETPETTTDVDADTQLAIEMISFNKYFESGSLKANAINPDDLGGMSLGTIQFRGGNAKKLLKAIYEANPKATKEIASKYDSNYISYLDNSDTWWMSHATEAGSDEYNYLSELLIQDWAVDVQWDIMIEYEKGIIADAREHGINDKQSIILYSRAVNYGYNTGSSESLRAAGEENGGNLTFEQASSCVQFSKANEAIRILDTMSFDIITVDDIKA